LVRERRRGAGSRLLVVAAALVAYLPIVMSSPGRVGADTKTYLYLDPGRMDESGEHRCGTVMLLSAR